MNLKRTQANAAGTQLCVTLVPPCNSIETLCSSAASTGTCMYALFNQFSNQTCCPVGVVGPPPKPPSHLHA